jgi:hypothetical protein
MLVMHNETRTLEYVTSYYVGASASLGDAAAFILVLALAGLFSGPWRSAKSTRPLTPPSDTVKGWRLHRIENGANMQEELRGAQLIPTRVV